MVDGVQTTGPFAGGGRHQEQGAGKGVTPTPHEARVRFRGGRLEVRSAEVEGAGRAQKCLGTRAAKVSCLRARFDATPMSSTLHYAPDAARR